MNSLSRHIEYLLLTHNCVVVPQFGAFVTREYSASRAESESLFFPPSRVVRFNPDVTEDDGLLVGVVRALHRCRTAEAKRLVQGMVLTLRQQLLADSQVDFGTIGVFTQDEDGHVNFEPCQAGAVTPALYGLDAFPMPRLTELQRHESQVHRKKAKASDEERDTGSHIIIRINRQAVRYAALAAAAVLICVLFAIPVDLPLQPPANQASILPASTVTAPASKPVTPAVSATPLPPETTLPEAPAAPTDATPTADAAGAKDVAPAETPAPQYAIVLASNVGRKNAQSYVDDLQLRGYENAMIHDNGKMLRVVLSGYATEADAYRHNSILHRQGKEFANAWVMKL